MPDEAPPEPPGRSLGRGELQDRAVRGAGWTVVHVGVSLPVAFLANVALARFLGVGGYGRLALLGALLALAQGLASQGLSTALLQFGAKAHAAGRVLEVQRMLSASQAFRLLVVAPALTVVLLVAVEADTAWTVAAVLLGVWLPAALEGASASVQIENKTAAGAKIAMVGNVPVQVATVLVAWQSASADLTFITRLVVGVVTALASLAVMDPRYRYAALRPHLGGFPPGFWRFGIPIAASGLLGSLVVSRTEVFVLEWLSTSTALGLFAMAFGLATHLFAPAQALVGPLVPAVSGLHEVDQASVGPAFERVLRAGSTVVGLVSAAAIPPLAILVPDLYGPEFADAAPMLLALGVAAAFTVLTGPVSAFVMARLSARRILVANVVALVVDVALALALIPPFGAWGAIAANTGAVVVLLLLLAGTESTALGMPLQHTLALQLPVLLGVGASALAWVSVTGLGLGPVSGALVAPVVGLVPWLLAVRLLRTGVTRADAAALVRVLPRSAQRWAGPAVTLLARAD